VVTHKERILRYLWSVSPQRVTNRQIRKKTGIKSHQQVYMLTQELLWAGAIQGEKRWREWLFWIPEAPLFEPPEGLVEVAHFTVPRVQVWGTQKDAEYKERVRQASGVSPDDAKRFEWFAFRIRGVVGESRGRWLSQTPDVENIPKLIVDAFTGLLYPDDNLHHVRGVQVEAKWGPDEEEQAEIWIYGHFHEGHQRDS